MIKIILCYKKLHIRNCVIFVYSVCVIYHLMSGLHNRASGELNSEVNDECTDYILASPCALSFMVLTPEVVFWTQVKGIHITNTNMWMFVYMWEWFIPKVAMHYTSCVICMHDAHDLQIKGASQTISKLENTIRNSLVNKFSEHFQKKKSVNANFSFDDAQSYHLEERLCASQCAHRSESTSVHYAQFTNFWCYHT